MRRGNVCLGIESMRCEIRSYERQGNQGKKGNILDRRISTIWEKKHVASPSPLIETDLSTVCSALSNQAGITQGMAQDLRQHNGQSL